MKFKITTKCEIVGCEELAKGRKHWCQMHYMRWYRHGDPLYKRPKKFCSIADCQKTSESRGWCKEHYDRWIRHGDPTVVIDTTSRGSLSNRGYLLIHKAGHPLAMKGGRVAQHRVVLYEKIGPGDHLCNWCGACVSWDKSWPVHSNALVTDHLDHDRLNNDPGNLVPSCQSCNVRRRNPSLNRGSG